MTSSNMKDLKGKVDASPTKRFFIAVLIKDIQLIDAVVELVDNSVDAAKAMSKDGNLSGREIFIDYSDTFFSISDNAGGISIRQAKSFAFRFGRADDAPLTPGAVGEFGVGMKRALFKIGRNFSVASSTATEEFLVEVDVDQWEADREEPEEWTFHYGGRGPGMGNVIAAIALNTPDTWRR
jgi:Histidine kinase-, DNA gyrase B-, and HSP90-like ATPase